MTHSVNRFLTDLSAGVTYAVALMLYLLGAPFFAVAYALGTAAGYLASVASRAAHHEEP